MKIDNILTFIAIVDHKGILKAADHLFVSQSTVSNRLLQLEESLNTKLIDRNPGQKGLTLTKRGEEFLAYAREYVFLNDTIQEWSARTPRERLRVGTIDSISGPLLKTFYPKVIESSDIFLEISHHWTDRIFELLDNHHLDVGIIPRLFYSKSIETIPLFEEKMVVVSFNKMAKKLHPDQLDPSFEIQFDWGNPFVNWHRTWFDPTIRPKMKVDITEPLFEALKLDGCWAIVPVSVATDFHKRLKFNISDLSVAPPKRIGYFATRPDIQAQKRQAVDQLRDMLIEFIKDHDSLQLIE